MTSRLPLLQKHCAEILVANFEPGSPAGESRGVQVVLRCDSEAAVRAWYDDPEYELIRAIRHASCTCNSMAVAKGFVPPES